MAETPRVIGPDWRPWAPLSELIEAKAERDRYREALEFIRRHAELDLGERGVREAERYLGLAREALDG